MKNFKTFFTFVLICIMASTALLTGCGSSKAEATTSAVQDLKQDKSTSKNKKNRKEISETAYFPTKLSGSPDIVAESAIVMETKTGEVLYSKNADTKRYPASITKVMTALLAIENCKMDDIVEFTDKAVNSIEAGSSSAGINAGAKLTVKDTLHALMLVSANEAGAALAEHIAGSNEAFAKMMNEKAKALGCKNTHFTNPHGLPDENHYTCARDMALIMKEALTHDEFQEISSTLHYNIKKGNGLNDPIDMYNHSKILQKDTEYYYEYARTSKTGFTQAALNTLITSAKKDGIELVCVILKDDGAHNSYYDTANLFKWAFQNIKSYYPLKDFRLSEAVARNNELTEDQITNINYLDCTFNEDLYLLSNDNLKNNSFNIKFELNEDQNAGRMGYLLVSYKDKYLGCSLVTYDKNTDKSAAYMSGEKVGDGLETADVDTGISPTVFFWILVSLVVLFIIIYIVLSVIKSRKAEKRRRERMKNRAQMRQGNEKNG